ncbi:alpha/beta fold hydrolase [Glaciecola petra]|uniref:Alpha/beta hydrolase n=1 Tax=Glaciecola petra TaxID=3075602 RepID=A0ABU2ZNH7_9ALTE|nr:alpha/beta hydrolase [Aestuariibacter sp. P117]MDT0594182.1 alpha/beta hydrolase [Aestuariibacter sp. P117]
MSSSQVLHFAHANGFPAESYNKLFKQLTPRYKVIAKDKFTHNNAYPLNDNWESTVDELVDYTEHHLTKGEKAIAVGHSFGAVISYKAVCKRPDLFSQLIMLEPPLITGITRLLFKIAKRTRFINNITPAGITQIRKQKWYADQDLFDYFSKKALFKHFDPECITDYISAATQQNGAYKVLTFEVQNEADIFRTIPHNLPSYYQSLKVPSTLVSAEYTNVCVPYLRKPFLRHNNNMKHIEFASAGHMFPLEKPIEVASLIENIALSQVT